MKKCKVCRKKVKCKELCDNHYKRTVYEKTINGFLMRAYRNMKSRVTGVQKNYMHIYLGKDILKKEVFYDWSRNDRAFLKLYKEWVNNNYDRRLTPSVNRIETNKGYTLNNIEWITNSQNSALASISKKLNDKEKRAIYKSLGIGK